MDHLNRLSSYFAEKERKRLDSVVRDSRTGLPEMTPAEIKLTCVENNGYETPELNEKIYLHFRGFKKIENLDPYTNCKALWLDSNGFDAIEGLDTLVELRCLYLSKNMIGSISGLSCLQQLVTLDLSYNRLTKIENLSCCPRLETVNVARNALNSSESVRHFCDCPSIKNIDMTNNRLPADEVILDIIYSIPGLVALSVNGNEMTKIAHFRKRVIASMPQLGYLDRPIDEQERFSAAAFAEGGTEAETAARDRWREMQREKRINEMETFKAWQVEQKKLRDQAQAEGRILYQLSDFTPEELETRRQEAERAAEAEQRMLNLGVGKLAGRYWQLEGQAGDSSSSRREDLLEEAARQLIEEEEKEKFYAASFAAEDSADPSTATTMESKAATEILSEDAIVLDLDAGAQSLIKEQEMEPEQVSTTLSVDCRAPEEGQFQLDGATLPAAAMAPAPELLVERGESDVVESPTPASLTAEDKAKLRREEAERQQRVADSMRIYKQQLADEKMRQGQKASGLVTAADGSHLGYASKSSTWASAGGVESNGLSDTQFDGIFYWTEIMDLRLAQEVRFCVFDFDAIAMKMQKAAEEGALNSPRGGGGGGRFRSTAILADPQPSMFTAEACRLRWAQLDADQWSQSAPETSALDTVYKICIQPEVLGAGHGGQPTFQALKSMAAGSMPAYLTPPTVFPSVRDADEDDEDDRDDVQPLELRPGVATAAAAAAAAASATAGATAGASRAKEGEGTGAPPQLVSVAPAGGLAPAEAEEPVIATPERFPIPEEKEEKTTEFSDAMLDELD